MCPKNQSQTPFWFWQIVQRSQCMQEILFTIRYFKGIIKKPLKSSLDFYPLHPVPLYEQDYEKRGLELITNFSLSDNTYMEKFLFQVISHLGNFED